MSRKKKTGPHGMKNRSGVERRFRKLYDEASQNSKANAQAKALENSPGPHRHSNNGTVESASIGISNERSNETESFLEKCLFWFLLPFYPFLLIWSKWRARELDTQSIEANASRDIRASHAHGHRSEPRSATDSERVGARS